MVADSQTETATLRDGSQVLIRPIRQSDALLERNFIEGLSAQSRRFRFLASINTPSDELVERLTNLNPDTEVALIALAMDKNSPREVGVARFCIQPSDGAEIAVTVDDHWQRKGLATILMQRLIKAARERGVRRLYSLDAGNNQAMRDFAAHLGFARATDPLDATQVIYSLSI